jgi:hypothetical protein
MESTMLRSFIKIARIKAWLARPSCPPAIREIKALFDKIFIKTLPNQTDDAGGQSELDPASEPGIATRILHARFKYRGVMYSRSSTHLGNSLILYFHDGDKASYPLPAQIEYICTEGSKTLFYVKRHLPRNAEVIDPFEAFMGDARLFSATLEQTPRLVELDWIMGHFARYPVSQDHVVVVSLCSVSSISLASCSVLTHHPEIGLKAGRKHFLECLSYYPQSIYSCCPHANSHTISLVMANEHRRDFVAPVCRRVAIAWPSPTDRAMGRNGLGNLKFFHILIFIIGISYIDTLRNVLLYMDYFFSF